MLYGYITQLLISLVEICGRKSRNSSSGDTDVTWAENQDAETGNTIQTRLPRDIAALSRSCIVCGRKCWAKLTWYHFAAAFLHPVYREHDSLKSNSVEHKLHTVRLDMKGMVASLEDKALGAPPKKTEAQSSVVTVVGLFMTPETVGADSVASWLSAHCLSRLRLNLQLHSIDLVRTCHISSFCTVAWQLARFQLTQRIARSLGDSWASCFLTAMKSQILPQLLMRSMLIPLQISTLRTGMTHLWLSGSRIALACQNWRSSLEVSIFDSGIAEQAKERSVQLDTWWLTWP